MNRRDRARALLVSVVRAIGGAVIGGFAAMLLCLIFFFVAPGSWFLESQGPVTVKDTLVGEDVPFTWCRTPRLGLIEATATRTFYRQADAGEWRTVSDYVAKFPIEPTSQRCNNLDIKTALHPQQPGRYYFTTDITWRQNGFEKHLSYQSTPYSLDQTPQQLRERLREVERELRGLRDRLGIREPQRSTARGEVAVLEPAVQQSTARTSEPTTSAPPEREVSTPQPEPATPSPDEPSLLGGLPLLGPVLGGLGL